MRFQYKAVDSSGVICRGQLEANNSDELDIRLQQMHLDLLSCRKASHNSLFAVQRLPRRDLLHFCLHLEHLLQAGVPLLDSLQDIRDSSPPGRLKGVLEGLSHGLDRGQSLSQAMEEERDVFTPVIITLIRAGETSGQLPEVMQALGDGLKWEDELAVHTKKLLLYPLLLGSVVLGATAFLMIYLVPQLKTFISSMGHAQPFYTHALFSISAFLAEHWPWLLLAGILAWTAVKLLFRQNAHARLQRDAVLLRLPLIGPILSKIALSRFASTLAMLYAAGTPLIDALHATRGLTGNAALENALDEAAQAIRSGRQIGTAFHEAGLFPPLLVRMLRVGENTGELDKALRNVAYFYNRDVRESVAQAQTLVEPLLTVLLGLLLGWIMLAVMGPIYDIISRIGP